MSRHQTQYYNLDDVMVHLYIKQNIKNCNLDAIKTQVLFVS